MSDISPSSSVSQGIGVGFDQCSINPVTPEFLKLIEVLAKSGATSEKLTGLTEAYLKSHYAAYHASLRHASSVSSSLASSDISYPSSGGSLVTKKWANSKLKKMGEAVSWRRDDAVQPQVVADDLEQIVVDNREGFCYLSMLKESFRAAYAASLGAWPIVADLLEVPLSHVDLPSFTALRVDVSGKGWHIGANGQYTLREVFQSAAFEVCNPIAKADSLYAVLKKAKVLSLTGCYFMCVGGSSQLSEWLIEAIGEDGDIPLEDYVLIQSSAALLREDRKRRLRSLEALGDSAITLVLAQDNYARGESVQRFQDLRSRVTNNKVLSETFVSRIPAGFVSFAGGVDPNAGVTGAKALEAIFGAIWLKSGVSGVSKFLRFLGLVKFDCV